MITTLVSYSQSMLFGPMVTTSMSTSVGADVESYGPPTRYSIGVQFSRRSASGSEYSFTVQHRMESGGYLTNFVKPSGGIVGKLNVVDVPTGGPVIITTLDATAIEAGAGIRLPVLALDSNGTRVLFQFGINIDRVLSMTQVDNFSRVPEAERGNIPRQTTITFDGQTGFGGQLGLALSAPAGDGRFLIELLYNVRQPLTIAFPAGTAAPGAEQNIGWLLGRSIRLGASYQFKL